VVGGGEGIAGHDGNEAVRGDGAGRGIGLLTCFGGMACDARLEHGSKFK
jgi:hypothetical protein